MGIIILHVMPSPDHNLWQPERVERVKVTSLGDEFIYIYEYQSFLNKKSVSICDKAGEHYLAEYSLEDNERDPDLGVILDDKDIRCYEVKGRIIYTIDNITFKGTSISMIQDSDPEENPALVTITKSLFQTKEWKWVEACGAFLMNSGDHDVIQTLTRYAQGSFTQEELDINKNSMITKDDIQDYAKRLINQ
jgi:hypothetical protein